MKGLMRRNERNYQVFRNVGDACEESFHRMIQYGILGIYANAIGLPPSTCGVWNVGGS
jgi:hypothetical protein